MAKGSKSSSLKEAEQNLKEGQNFFFSSPPNFAQAAHSFKIVTKLAPNWAEGFVWLGSALDKQSRFAEATAAFTRAIVLNPADPRPQISLGCCLLAAGKPSAAEKSFREGLSLKPHYAEADARLFLAEALTKLGRTNEAFAEWRTVAQMKPMYPSYEAPIEEARRELAKQGKAV